MNKQDIFGALKISYIVGKIFGSISYTVKGHPKNRKIITTTFDKIIFLIRLIILLTIYVKFLIKIMKVANIQKIFQELRILYFYTMNFLMLVLILYVVKMNWIWKDKVLNILQKLEKIYNYFERRQVMDYSFIRRCSVIITICSFHLSFIDFFVDYFYLINFLFIEAIIRITILIHAVSLENDLMTFLFLIQYAASKLNKSFRKRVPNCFETKIFLKNLFQKHYELFEICKKTNVIYYFLIIRLFITMFAFSMFLYDVQLGGQPKLFHIVHFFWVLANIFPIMMICFFCVIVSEEVGFDFFIWAL